MLEDIVNSMVYNYSLDNNRAAFGAYQNIVGSLTGDTYSGTSLADIVEATNSNSNYSYYSGDNHNGESNKSIYGYGIFPSPDDYPDNFGHKRYKPYDDPFVGTKQIYFQGSANHNLNIFTGLTVSFWFKSCETDFYLPSNWSDYHYDPFILPYFQLSDEDWKFFTISDHYYFGNSSSSVSICKLSANTDDWHHMSITYDNGDIDFYLDGVLTGSTTGSVPTNSKIKIGANVQTDHLFSTSGDGDHFTIETYTYVWSSGKYDSDPRQAMSNFIINNRPLTNIEINYIMNNT